MKNRGVINSGPRLPGSAHKQDGRPGDLPGRIAVQDRISPDPETASDPGKPDLRDAAPESSSGPRIPDRAPAPKPASAPLPRRKYSLTLKIETVLADEFASLLASYPVGGRRAIRHKLAAAAQERLARELPAAPLPRLGTCSSVRLDLRLSGEIVARLLAQHDPHGLMPTVTVLARAVEPIYAQLLSDVLRKTGHVPFG
ncbi:hypothetical protein HOY34_07545 [Xinfangfangia sp. D13-10-4-6]|uniref:hypothetical protein n=1 Tax=Pseudogemmobacter hezensis TaxID=2737662 RepID=UPI00155439CF|nr:hypothetical protein [Pseudogemmobacter hezensis]NPD15056.1 hypothetical protein [Pseudogemmobacter hezensis]